MKKKIHNILYYNILISYYNYNILKKKFFFAWLSVLSLWQVWKALIKYIQYSTVHIQYSFRKIILHTSSNQRQCTTLFDGQMSNLNQSFEWIHPIHYVIIKLISFHHTYLCLCKYWGTLGWLARDRGRRPFIAGVTQGNVYSNIFELGTTFRAYRPVRSAVGEGMGRCRYLQFRSQVRFKIYAYYHSSLCSINCVGGGLQSSQIRLEIVYFLMQRVPSILPTWQTLIAL